MSKKISDLPFDGQADLLSKIADSFESFSKKRSSAPVKSIYKIAHTQEPSNILRSVRKNVLISICPKSITKFAFDTRRIDQQTERNPRSNLQYWNRSEEFIDEELSGKINIFAKLLNTLKDIKEDYGDQREYLESYARILHDHVNRILRVEQGDNEIFKPQVAYLEQLLFARYRLSMDELSKIGNRDLKKRILEKDENLLKRGAFLLNSEDKNRKDIVVLKNGDGSTTQDSIVNAIFGKDSAIRREGER